MVRTCLREVEGCEEGIQRSEDGDTRNLGESWNGRSEAETVSQKWLHPRSVNMIGRLVGEAER